MKMVNVFLKMVNHLLTKPFDFIVLMYLLTFCYAYRSTHPSTVPLTSKKSANSPTTIVFSPAASSVMCADAVSGFVYSTRGRPSRIGRMPVNADSWLFVN